MGESAPRDPCGALRMLGTGQARTVSRTDMMEVDMTPLSGGGLIDQVRAFNWHVRIVTAQRAQRELEDSGVLCLQWKSSKWRTVDVGQFPSWCARKAGGRPPSRWSSKASSQ
jgi:hypothetical protein